MKNWQCHQLTTIVTRDFRFNDWARITSVKAGAENENRNTKWIRFDLSYTCMKEGYEDTQNYFINLLQDIYFDTSTTGLDISQYSHS